MPLNDPLTNRQHRVKTIAELSENSGPTTIGEGQATSKRIEPEGSAVDKLLIEAPTRVEEVLTTNATQGAALKSPRGHLLLTLIDQSTAVTLPLLIPVLDRIAWFLAEERESSLETRKALIQTLFQTIASGMDMRKRETAAKWYLDRRDELEIEMAQTVQAHL